MKVYKHSVGPFAINTYILTADNGECLLIDPGDEPEKIIDFMDDNNLSPKAIINTHNHIDHVRYLSRIKNYYHIPFHIHEDDLPLLEGLKEQALLFGMDTASIPEVDDFLNDGDVFELEDLQIQILHTPGHSPGSICLYLPGHLFSGDVLFKESIGRTDLYGGNLTTLLQSIKEKILTLPDYTVVHPGHGEETTIANEKLKNPFLQNLQDV